MVGDCGVSAFSSSDPGQGYSKADTEYVLNQRQFNSARRHAFLLTLPLLVPTEPTAQYSRARTVSSRAAVAVLGRSRSRAPAAAVTRATLVPQTAAHT